MARRRPARAPFKVGDAVTGTTYVEPTFRGREAAVEFAGTVVQIGSGWAGVEADLAFLWARLPSGREVKAPIRDVERA